MASVFSFFRGGEGRKKRLSTGDNEAPAQFYKSEVMEACLTEGCCREVIVYSDV